MQPGESGKIPVKLSTGHVGGHVGKSITVTTNAPGSAATINLKLEGDVWMPVEVKPQVATFGRITSDGAKDPALVQTLTIVNNMEANADIKDVRCTNPTFHVESKVIEAGRQFELKVAFAKPPQAGNVSGSIEMSTGIKEMPTLAVPVNAYVTADVEVMPANLVLPPDIPAVTNRQLFVQNNSKTPVKLSDMQVSNPEFKVAVEELQAGMKYKLNVDVPAGYKAPPSGDQITFKTDNPTVPELKILVTQMRAQPVVPGAPAGNASTGGTAPAAAATKAMLSGHPVDPSKADDNYRVTNPNIVKPAPERMGTERMAPKLTPRPAPPTPTPTTMPAGK